MECGLEASQFCFLSDEYILTGTYEFKITTFASGYSDIANEKVSLSNDNYTFEGIVNGHLKYCVGAYVYNTYSYFNAIGHELNIPSDTDFSGCTEAYQCSDNDSKISSIQIHNQCKCVENLNQYLDVIQCTLKQTASTPDIVTIKGLSGVDFNDIARDSDTYSDYLTTNQSTQNILSRKRHTMFFYTTQPDEYDVKIDYSPTTLWINTNPSLNNTRYGDYMVFEEAVDIREGAIMYGWNGTDSKTAIEYEYISPRMMFIKNDSDYENIGFDYFKLGGVFREGIPMRGKFYNSREGYDGLPNQHIFFNNNQHIFFNNNFYYYRNYPKNLEFSSDDFKHLKSLDQFETSGLVDFRTHPNNMFGLYEELEWDHTDYLEFAIEGNHITIRNRSREGR